MHPSFTLDGLDLTNFAEIGQKLMSPPISHFLRRPCDSYHLAVQLIWSVSESLECIWGHVNSPSKELVVADSILIKHVDERILLLRQLKVFNCVSRLADDVVSPDECK